MNFSARAFYRRFKNAAASQTGRDFAKTPLALPFHQTSKSDGNPLRAYFNAHRQGPGIWKWDHYLDVYHRHFSKFRGRQVTVLEIGIYSGGSLLMWRDYFGADCTIYGVDIQSECLAYENAFTHVLIGDQADPRFWAKAKQSLPRLDIVIDDGGHGYAQQRKTLECLLPHMCPGGVYVCEDVHGAENRFAAFSFGIVDALNNAQYMAHDLDDPEKRLVSKTVGLQAAIKAICFYPFIMTIELQDTTVSQLIAPKRGTKWQPFVT
jgi:cephalosporin hydroxylase